YPGAVAINSRIFDGRPACNYCGGCDLGCPIGAKANTAITHFPKAMKLGVEVRPLCYATEIKVDAQGKARSVVYVDSQGQQQEQEARVVVVACWTIESPRLLLNSVSPKFPNGLANGSGLVGRYLTCILGGRTTGIFDEVVDGFRGYILNNLESRHFYKTNPKNDYWGGFTFETSNARDPLRYASLRGPLWGRRLVEHMKTFRRHYALSAWGRGTVSEENRVTVDGKVKDRFGIPAAKITYHFSDNDRRQCRAMNKRGREIFKAAGATDVVGDDGPRGSYWLGGIRMGSDPAKSVTDGYGRCHDVKNLFVAGPSLIPAAIGVQPTLTVVAMSIRTAEFISRNRSEF
ncbi:MAG: GMC family oxidoreductase, partial [Acidobacteria bacterium]|nr:GMC family oxidoreductase [Acidobacteriota bacterium]